MVWGSSFSVGLSKVVWYDKEVSVEASLLRQRVEERRSWDVRFIRDFNDWEMDEGLHFLRILEANTPPMEAGD